MSERVLGGIGGARGLVGMADQGAASARCCTFFIPVAAAGSAFRRGVLEAQPRAL
jgi:hypothetical protein